MTADAHPCRSCCAHFRVAFHWSETEAFVGGSTPAELTEKLDPHRVVMRGTLGGAAPRCIALEGEVGQHSSCRIYDLRPSPCRELKPAWEDGEPSPQCDRARLAHGLPPLTPDSWDTPSGPGWTPLRQSA